MIFFDDLLSRPYKVLNSCGQHLCKYIRTKQRGFNKLKRVQAGNNMTWPMLHCFGTPKQIWPPLEAPQFLLIGALRTKLIVGGFRFFTSLALFVLETIPSAVWHTDRLGYWLILGNYGSRIPTLSVLINLGLGRLLISSNLTRVSGIVSENKINVPCPRAEYFTAFLKKLITYLILFSMVNSILR